jgi:uncharacterized membrane protein (UPF0182 family)
MTEQTKSEKGTRQEVKKPTEPAIQKQYELVVGVYQTESSAFWTRFNIFTAIEFAGILGLLSNLKLLAANPVIFRCVMVFFCLLSVLVIIIAVRGIQSSRMLLHMIAHVEARSMELLPLVQLTKTLDRLPQYVNFIIAVIIAILFSMAWMGALIFFEVTNYNIVVPK